jgi:predicted RNA-binding protein with PIN domain
MADEHKTIHWNSVVTNAVSTLVAAVFVGAAVIVWNAATTIDTRIEIATNDIKENQGTLQNTQGDLRASQKTLTDEIASLHAEIRRLKSQLDSHDDVLRNKSIASSISKGKPLILPKYEVSAPQQSKLKEKDVERILNKYQKNRFEIQRQSVP